VGKRSPVDAMSLEWKWGDQQYPSDGLRQEEFFGFSEYTDGPTGQMNKQLHRPGTSVMGTTIGMLPRRWLGLLGSFGGDFEVKDIKSHIWPSVLFSSHNVFTSYFLRYKCPPRSCHLVQAIQ